MEIDWHAMLRGIIEIKQKAERVFVESIMRGMVVVVDNLSIVVHGRTTEKANGDDDE